MKEILAYEATKICRGAEEANKARNREVTEEIKVNNGDNIVDVLVKNGLCKSNGEARRLIEGNGVKFNGEVVDKTFTINIAGDLMVGKKRKVTIKI